jgi:hypothetical protein
MPNAGKRKTDKQENNKPAKKAPREEWAEACRKMHEKGDDKLLIDDMIDLDICDWEWQ